jgi:hypothetical protein
VVTSLQSVSHVSFQQLFFQVFLTGCEVISQYQSTFPAFFSLFQLPTIIFSGFLTGFGVISQYQSFFPAIFSLILPSSYKFTIQSMSVSNNYFFYWVWGIKLVPVYFSSNFFLFSVSNNYFFHVF